MASKCSNPDPGNPDEFCFQSSFPLRAGILFLSQIGLVSFALAASLLIYSMRQAQKRYRRGFEYEPEPISVLFLFAISLDAIQGISNVMSVKWAFEGEVTEGSYCTAQAVMKQIGNDGVAWFTIAIAVLTYLRVFHPGFLRERGEKIFMTASISFVALFIFIMVLIPAATLYPYYGDTGLWCWIVKRKENSRLRIASEYAWMWLAVLVAIAAYGAIAYRLLRHSDLYIRPLMRRSAIAMGWYPIVYFVVVTPQSIVRFLQFQANQTHHGWMIFTSAIFSSGGTFNVVLWLWTGRRFGFSSQDHEVSSLGDVELDPA
ncbi:uncharacterized protein EI90DRAFT_3046603 [Cantharellus anzutake]|uniref:uncharacterized protein n=1 Tax=Cantharellus anzutake TaxID=1750568 RepID=UPI001902F4B2|nr:uncharacterized protein EI90DRAFT_3046603 [Cantharellus anzutake]KAF8336639.1 hypothetical protein EI90DRAFT_3046603 [Cantharellus anzutake]